MQGVEERTCPRVFRGGMISQSRAVFQVESDHGVRHLCVWHGLGYFLLIPGEKGCFQATRQELPDWGRPCLSQRKEGRRRINRRRVFLFETEAKREPCVICFWSKFSSIQFSIHLSKLDPPSGLRLSLAFSALATSSGRLTLRAPNLRRKRFVIVRVSVGSSRCQTKERRPFPHPRPSFRSPVVLTWNQVAFPKKFGLLLLPCQRDFEVVGSLSVPPVSPPLTKLRSPKERRAESRKSKNSKDQLHSLENCKRPQGNFIKASRYVLGTGQRMISGA